MVISAERNDVTAREARWRRFAGDDWACFDALPAAVRSRLRNHAYDAWSVNALRLWRALRRERGAERAERALLLHIERCEAEERALFAEAYRSATGAALPHDAAGATVLRAEGAPVGPLVGPLAGGARVRQITRLPCSRSSGAQVPSDGEWARPEGAPDVVRSGTGRPFPDERRPVEVVVWRQRKAQPAREPER